MTDWLLEEEMVYVEGGKLDDCHFVSDPKFGGQNPHLHGIIIPVCRLEFLRELHTTV